MRRTRPKKNGDMILYETLLSLRKRTPSMASGILTTALAKSHQALQLGNQFSDESGILQALNVTARIDTSMGRLDEAQASLQQSLARAEKRGLLESEINILAALGRNAARQGNLRKAAEYFRRDVSLARSSEHAATSTQRGDQPCGDRVEVAAALASWRDGRTPVWVGGQRPEEKPGPTLSCKCHAPLGAVGGIVGEVSWLDGWECVVYADGDRSGGE